MIRETRGGRPPVDVTEATFEAEVIERSREHPVVVDFWAGWCQPCLMLAPVLEAAVAEREDAVVLARVDVDSEPGLAQRFAVRGIPAVKGFRHGRVVGEFTGARGPEQVAEFLDALAGPSEAERAVDVLRDAGDLPDVLEALERLDYEAAFERLLARLDDADESGRDRIRLLMVALFRDLGAEDPVGSRYRRRLASALF